ncbi:MAG: flagellar protein [Bacilli bacterium]|nr:flagellar protein [Bacilli bacterium]
MTKYIHPLHQHAIQHTNVKPFSKQTNTKFSEVLKEYSTLVISKHAKERMAERNIKIDAEKWRQIQEKVFEAKQKGVTDALVVVDDATLIVSAKNNTVVTALHKADAKEKIFTNINGTILL